MKIKCPICGNIVEDKCYSGPWGTEEEYINCENCNYSYEFAYGNYKEIVSDICFLWSYHTKWDNPIFKKRKRKTFMAKRNWNRYKKKMRGKTIIYG